MTPCPVCGLAAPNHTGPDSLRLDSGIDAYRIGYGWPSRLRMTVILWRTTGTEPVRFMRRSSDRWRRCWQAEWPGCQKAVRAWTRTGVYVKAQRAVVGT